ncbi:Protein CBG25318 [Caenorhabditis briggsae]|uniref:Protein CBG25318 n=1 Tax=Caenorhabditis briggsae TaxID=6238 RepID=B6IH16_CAEBR|nr:Protein CBG25318 [Caenorhabditis briggsae]CAR99196.1 Protein CBG25318 [Caenorhabditis briggsae]
MGVCLAFLSQQRRKVFSFASRIASWRTRQLDNASVENKESSDQTVCNHFFVGIAENAHDPSVDEKLNSKKESSYRNQDSPNSQFNAISFLTLV